MSYDDNNNKEKNIPDKLKCIECSYDQYKKKTFLVRKNLEKLLMFY